MATAVHVEVISASRDQASILANLLELYIHDFSEFLNVAPGPDGRFGYPRLPLYWSDPGRYPFLVKVDGQWAGFALVKQGSEVSDNADVWDIAEFFVLRGYRRQGIGTHVAQEVWRRLPGRWEVRVMQSNVSGYDFWLHTISMFTGGQMNPVRIQKGSECWNLFSFESTESTPVL